MVEVSCLLHLSDVHDAFWPIKPHHDWVIAPGHSQVLSHRCGEKSASPQLRDKLWEWPGNEANWEIGTAILFGI